ncbi:MAG: methylated-DNA--[protein]-cysteine S-methyltransferase [Gemmatimonadetes bacterium]|nr:methylated-DNA--[protein]-cysteine S-methyltransferase [Gemmatimonadota bacterium]
MASPPFLVASDLVNLAVTVQDGAVTQIRLHGRVTRPPETPFERQVTEELSEYLAGQRSRFTLHVSPTGTDFERRCWDALQQIPYGETRTYAEIARVVGNPNGYRAVGSANHKNPIPIIIPCHRVVASGGGLGGYGGGLDLKRRLLALEQARHPPPALEKDLGGARSAR